MSARRSMRPWSLVLVQDDADETAAAERALRDAAVRHVLAVARDGDQALALLRHEPDRPEPDLVILDLHRVRGDGREVLGRIKGDPALRHVPVLVLSASDGADDEITACYRLHANCCLRKPATREGLAALMRAVASFWLGGAVMLPARALVRDDR